MKFLTGQEIAIKAMKKELSLLKRKAKKAKSDADECVNIGSEFIAIHKELAAIVESKETGAKVVRKLESLKKRRDRANKIMGKDVCKLFDNQYEYESAVISLANEISLIEFRMRV